MGDELRATALTEIHVELGARMGPFGGFNMPIQYEGIIKEHMATREAATLFDTCHMGEFRLRGAGAMADLEKIVSCDIASLADGRCRYGLMCNPEGGVIDDLLVYRFSGEDFMLVVNAGTQWGDFEWIKAQLCPDSEIGNISEETAKIDLQGPNAPRIMQRLMDDSIAGLRFYGFMPNHYKGKEVLISRTGYTGEIGFEVYGSAELAQSFWREAMQLGAVPAGLGARDTLRLEMGMPLYGHELSENRNAGEAGFTAPIVADRTFTGSDRVRDKELHQARLVGLALEGRRAAREGDKVTDREGNQVGIVSSGSMAPSLGHAIALAYVAPQALADSVAIQVATSRSALPAEIVALPFYKDATGRRPLAEFL